ncbi:MAG: hypothetical protein GXP33_16390 [Spirochaetes bacterium]|nr:hypothetical protein [Spirochaetota bacterium]
MNTIDKDITAKSIGNLPLKEAKLRNTGSVSKSNIVQGRDLNTDGKEPHMNIVSERFVLYNKRITDIILARDALLKAKQSTAPEQDKSGSLSILSKILDSAPARVKRILAGYIDSGKFKSVDSLKKHFDFKLKKLQIIMQNIDSLQDNPVNNPGSLLKEVEQEIKSGNFRQFHINTGNILKLLQ